MTKAVATKEQTKDAYDFRRKAMQRLKYRLKKKDINVITMKKRDKRLKGADFYIDDLICKFKAVRRTQVNILFEVMNGPRYGWFAKTKANKLFYYVDEENIVYVIDVKRAKDYINNPLNKVEKTEKGFYGGGWGYMIPIETCMKTNIITAVMNL
jgi:hypothetical protein